MPSGAASSHTGMEFKKGSRKYDNQHLVLRSAHRLSRRRNLRHHQRCPSAASWRTRRRSQRPQEAKPSTNRYLHSRRGLRGLGALDPWRSALTGRNKKQMVNLIRFNIIFNELKLLAALGNALGITAGVINAVALVAGLERLLGAAVSAGAAREVRGPYIPPVRSDRCRSGGRLGRTTFSA